MAHPIETQRNLQDVAGVAGVVDAGNLVSFATNAPEQARQDLLNSNLLAQLAADKRCSRFGQSADWYKFYGDTLSNLAWQVTGMAFTRYMPPGLQFNPREIILAEMSRMVSPEDVPLVRNAIDATNSLPTDARPRMVLDQFSCTDHELNLQVCFAKGASAIDIVCLVFATEALIENPLTQEFEVSALKSDIRIARLSGAINERVYPMIRQSVIDKLGAKREAYILPVEAGDATT